MKTVRRLLYADVLGAIAFVAVAFLALFFFIDVVDELERVGRGGYQLHQALLYCLLLLPGHLYVLMPIAVLIGTIYALARMAQSSEFTILRVSGLGPQRALLLLLGLGLAFAAATFVLGDYVAPASDREAHAVRTAARGGSVYGQAGTWLKDRQLTASGERSYSVQITAAAPDGRLRNVRLYEFDGDARLVGQLQAESAVVGDDGVWQLSQVQRSRWHPQPGGQDLVVAEERLASLEWESTLTRNVVVAAVRPPSEMSALDLFRYMTHLSDNEQAAQRYEIQFWKKVLYPLACLVMVMLALPFAYLHSRSGGISLKVFGGIMLGISFVLLNNVFTHIGLLQDWTPWVAAATPSAAYFLLSLLAFNWLVRHR
jgi:lipopolysaccharide export system permease protein